MFIFAFYQLDILQNKLDVGKQIRILNTAQNWDILYLTIQL